MHRVNTHSILKSKQLLSNHIIYSKVPMQLFTHLKHIGQTTPCRRQCKDAGGHRNRRSVSDSDKKAIYRERQGFTHRVRTKRGTRKIDTRTKGYYTKESKLRGQSHQIDEFRSMNEWTPRMQGPTASSERKQGSCTTSQNARMVYTTNGRKKTERGLVAW